ncbi:GTPase ObgE [Pediococcus pentosaceus]|jgi:GTP-binding protein|uniref:GTPase Obg n=4 Tax=Lactobacillaceae TaxID=33958 RepID=OBG_PEDPA|nr:MULTISPECIES: GTPase ObgE [Pediococcus]Q03F34.1 RecName: Full=GTPase Obg; AltName: Full=GTP-binding protein Obg [Pediococcus pentosaceus ATCC 25745]ABJ68188.1 Predicted GTPase [Pediococcus pentosaceus ATCC 25745]AHA05230.1 GTPase CgtA [Pediococcus pentosaceus SL4]ANI97783.1 GTPase ObgE [Pediococcus pentosaceus]ASC08299.1 GTPase Obg [Pediococcus pentosaceus]AVL01634.1 GTPase ObgE [Pediococcus pentosaceus]
MFVDQVKINVKAGNGGNGIVAFRREKYVPNGGPAGGDGGRGGNVVLKVDPGLRTLMDFRYRHKFKADSGKNGMNKQMTGRSSQDLVISVPGGTIVRDLTTGRVIGDLTDNGQELVVAKGGRGGRGNMRFASPRNPAPEISENGEPGEEIELQLELKVLADVGLLGFPSVGKSTLLSVVTSAKPKIAEYHFTTLVPNLGMVQLDDGRDFVIADIPGLIEGASQGVGLGFEFLRHVERTRVLLHLVDMSGMTEEDPFTNFRQINEELKKYNPELLERRQIIVPTKMDLPGSDEELKKFEKQVRADERYADFEIFPISSITHNGLEKLVARTADVLEEIPQHSLIATSDEETEKTYEFSSEKDFTIENIDDVWVIEGEKIEKLFKMTDTTHDESLLRFARQMRGMGIDDELRRLGARNGDSVQILDFVFEFVE